MAKIVWTPLKQGRFTSWITCNPASKAARGLTGITPAPRPATAQRREPITDAAHGEPWIWRYKDLRSWWTLEHHERIGRHPAGNPHRMAA